MKARNAALFLCALSFPLVTSCGGGGGGGGGGSTAPPANPGSPQGQLLDGLVAGIRHESQSHAGVTDDAGVFPYEDGESVAFYIGDILVGRALGAPIVTPVDFVAGATDEFDPVVTNVARFLQTLDDDGDPDNGIVIQPAVLNAGWGQSLDFVQSVAEFESDPQLASVLTALGVGPLVPVDAARAHLRSSLLSMRAGHYTGTFTGGDTGTFQFYLDRTGQILGCGFSDNDQAAFAFSGTTASDGSSVFGDVTTGASFSGTIADGAVGGDWINTLFSLQGTFEGEVEEAADLDLDPDALAAVVGDYQGTYDLGTGSGPFAADISAEGNLSAIAGTSIQVIGAVTSTDGGVAVSGMTEEGTLVTGTITGDVFSGTLSNPHTGESGTFQATKSQ